VLVVVLGILILGLLYKAQSTVQSVRGELVGVLIIMTCIPVGYLILNNLFIIFVFLEAQAISLVYFVLALIVFVRGEYLRRLLKSLESFIKQLRLEVVGTLFVQF
jgi:hypothetical protein